MVAVIFRSPIKSAEIMWFFLQNGANTNLQAAIVSFDRYTWRCFYLTSVKINRKLHLLLILPLNLFNLVVLKRLLRLFNKIFCSKFCNSNFTFGKNNFYIYKTGLEIGLASKSILLILLPSRRVSLAVSNQKHLDLNAARSLEVHTNASFGS